MSVRGSSGFTLIDLLIVVMILGILGMTVWPQFHSMIGEAKLNEAAGELAAGLQYAGNLAVVHQRPFSLLADADGNWFKVVDHRYKDDPTPHHSDDPPTDDYGLVFHPVEKTWYLIDFDTQAPYEGVDLTAAPTGGEIRFYPDGHSASSSHTFVLSYAGSQRTITVDGRTGRVSVQ